MLTASGYAQFLILKFMTFRSLGVGGARETTIPMWSRAPWGPKKCMGPKQMHKKGSHFINKPMLGGFPVSRKYVVRGVSLLDFALDIFRATYGGWGPIKA